MTWKEFKDKVEKDGVKDDDYIGYIDIGCMDADSMTVNHDDGTDWWEIH